MIAIALPNDYVAVTNGGINHQAKSMVQSRIADCREAVSSLCVALERLHKEFLAFHSFLELLPPGRDSPIVRRCSAAETHSAALQLS
eukprot:768461-Hanusia_phi.AAC.3